MELLIEEQSDTEAASIIKQGVRAYNKPYFGEALDFVIYATNNLNIIGGISGVILSSYGRIDFVWVDENHRNKNLGTNLFKKLEDFLRTKGCKFIQLDTLDFQARPFYEKLGFECIGTIPKWIEGRDCYFMRKVI